MWLLKDKDGGIIYMDPNKVMVVGRKHGDIILNDDDSISRKHASISVKPKDEWKENEPTSSCLVRDIGSKYGSYIVTGDNQKRVTNEVYSLNTSDEIKFGLQHSIFRIEYVPIIVVSSMLDDDQRAELQNIMNAVDGVFVPTWTDSCTHLTVSNATLTVKVVLALAAGIPIVNMDYWGTMLKAVKNKTTLPDPNLSPVSINEGLVNNESISLQVNNNRKTLFKNLVFVCFNSQQHRTNSVMIKAAGGRSLLYEKKPLKLKQLILENVILLQFPSESTQPVNTPMVSYEAIRETLRVHKRRMIPEGEIPLAILYCSIEKYCNPNFDFKKLMNRREQNSSLAGDKILAVDTQDVIPLQNPQVIDETLESQCLETNSLDAKRSTDGKYSQIDETTDYSSEFDSLPRKGLPMKAVKKNIVINETVEGSEHSENSIRKFFMTIKPPQEVKIQRKDKNVVADEEYLSGDVDEGKKRGRSDSEDESAAPLKKPHFGIENSNIQSAGLENRQRLTDEGISNRKKTEPNFGSDSDSDELRRSPEKTNRKNTKTLKNKLRLNDSDDEPEQSKKRNFGLNQSMKKTTLSTSSRINYDDKNNRESKSKHSAESSDSKDVLYIEASTSWTKDTGIRLTDSYTSRGTIRSMDSDSTDLWQIPSTSKDPPKKQQKSGNLKKNTSTIRRPSGSDPLEGDKRVLTNRKLNSNDKEEELNENRFAYGHKKSTGKAEKTDEINNMWSCVEDDSSDSDSQDDCPGVRKVEKLKQEKKVEVSEGERKPRSLWDNKGFGKMELEKQKREVHTNKKRVRSSSDECSQDEMDSKTLIKTFRSIKDEVDTEEGEVFKCGNHTLDTPNCTSTIMPLLRKDIKIDLNITEPTSTNFVKQYTTIPKRRITLKDLYVWKPSIIPNDRITRVDSDESDGDDLSENEKDRFGYVEISNKGTRGKDRGKVRV